MIKVTYSQEETHYQLSHALLFYRASGSTIATLHEIRNQKLLHGKSLDLQDIDELFHSQDQRTRMHFMPPEVVASSRNEILWFEKSRVRPIYFNAPELRRQFLNRISGRNVIWPNLLFRISHHKISCWAVKGGRKPGLNSSLYRAPFTNVFNTHEFCPPNEFRAIPFKNIIDYAPMAANMFFRGHFSHLYGDMEPRISHPQGLDRFWADMAKNFKQGKGNVFPSHCLVSAKLTVRDIIT